MLDVVFAVLSAFTMAVGVVLIRRSLTSSNFFSSVVVITLFGNIVYWSILLLLNPRSQFNLYGIIFFALAGFIHPGLARILYHIGVLRVGVSTNASIVATNPLFGTLFAVLLLNEEPTLNLWLGIASVVAGAAIIQTSMHNEGIMKGKKATLLISASASLTAGLGFVLRKMGLNFYDEPIAGAAIVSFAGLILHALIFTVSPKIRAVAPMNFRTFKLFWKGGLCVTIGTLIMFYAFQCGSISVVTPLMQTEPLFILLLTYLYLRKVEALSKKLVLGTLSIVVGIILVTAFKG